MKILTILSEARYEAIVPVIRENNFSNIFYCVKYSTFKELTEIFEAHKDSVDALLFSGSMLKNHFVAKFPEVHIPTFQFEHNYLLTALHLIRHCIDYPEIPLHQTFCDNLNNLINYEIFNEVLHDELMPKTFAFHSFSDDMYNEMAENVIALYESGEVKMSYFTISSLYEKVKTAGYNCKLIPIRSQDILITLKDVMDTVYKDKIISERTMLATIDYSHGEKLSFNEIEYREATLIKVLVDYKHKFNQPNISINKMQDRLEIYITSYCDPSAPYAIFDSSLEYIKNNFEYPVTIGIGLSRDMRSSRQASLTALQYAFDYGSSCTFGLEDETITGPLGSEYCLTINTNLVYISRNIAKELGIDPINYIRTMLVLGSENTIVNSDILAKYLNVTVRAASRIILILLEKDIIKEVHIDIAPKKGRPTKHYRLKTHLKII